jgi:hypothetical protein
MSEERAKSSDLVIRLRLALQAAWPYVHAQCTIASVRKEISELMNSKDLADVTLAEGAQNEPYDPLTHLRNVLATLQLNASSLNAQAVRELAQEARGAVDKIALFARPQADTESLDLSGLRQMAADKEFASYEFDDSTVGETSAWEQASPGNSWYRAVFFEPEDDFARSVRAEFVIEFAPDSDQVLAASASIEGSPIGRRAGASENLDATL